MDINFFIEDMKIKEKTKASITKPKGKIDELIDHKLNDRIPRIFYLNDDLGRVQFLDKRPSDIVEIGKVEWKPYAKCNQEVVIGCSKKMYNLNKKDEKFTTHQKNNLTNISLLKSHLQKCFRRKLTDLGIKTCVSMALIEKDNKQEGLFELLRRLTIIMIEDAFLSQSFTILLWFMVAMSKGLYLNKNYIQKILGIAKGMFILKVRDDEWEKTTIKENILLPKLFDKRSNYNGLEDILWCLQFRKSYGGMTGDLILLDKLTSIWYKRIEKNDFLCGYLKLKFRPIIKESDCYPLTKSEIILEAIDFHCSNIIDRVKEIDDTYDKRFLKQLMWDHQSSINKRCQLVLSYKKEKDYKNIWYQIEPVFRLCAMQIKETY